MALLSFIRGAVDGAGKSLATVRVALTGALGSDANDVAHVELIHQTDPDDDQLHKAHVAAHTLQVVPTLPTPLIVVDCKVRHVFLSNISAAIRTVSVRAITGSIEFLDSRPMAPGEVLSFEMGDTKCPGGLEWNADAAGVVGSVQAYTA